MSTSFPESSYLSGLISTLVICSAPQRTDTAFSDSEFYSGNLPDLCGRELKVEALS